MNDTKFFFDIQDLFRDTESHNLEVTELVTLADHLEQVRELHK